MYTPPACAQASLASDVHMNIPIAVLNIFMDPKYKGGAILGLPQSGVLKTPTASEISLNYTWLLPMVRAFPTKERIFQLHVKVCNYNSEYLVSPMFRFCMYLVQGFLIAISLSRFLQLTCSLMFF